MRRSDINDVRGEAQGKAGQNDKFDRREPILLAQE